MLLSEVLAKDSKKMKKAKQDSRAIYLEDELVSKIDDITNFVKKTPQADFATVNIALLIAAVRRLKKRLKKVQTRVHQEIGDRFKQANVELKRPSKVKKEKTPVQFIVGGTITEHGYIESNAQKKQDEAKPQIEIIEKSSSSAAAAALVQAPVQVVEVATVAVVEQVKEGNNSSDSDDDASSSDEDNDSDNEEEFANEQNNGNNAQAISADRGFAKFLDGNVGGNVMKMMQKMGYNFDNPHGLGKDGSGIVNPVKLEQKTKKIYNLVSDFTPQQQQQAVSQSPPRNGATAAAAANQTVEKPLYEMKPQFDIAPQPPNPRRAKKNAKQKAIEEGVAQASQQQKKKKQSHKEHQKQKRNSKKKLHNFITKEMAKLNL